MKQQVKLTLKQVRSQIKTAGSPAQAKVLGSFFKTGKGQYGEGDRFLGVKVPAVRRICRGAELLSEDDILALLHSPFHEERLLALLVLVRWFQKGDDQTKVRVFDLYIAHREYINNWDLVDLSAPRIVGPVLMEIGPERAWEFWGKLLQSAVLWDRRIAVLSTFYFIRQGEFEPILGMAELLLDDQEDLMHKAVGWMLREVGKQDEKVLKGFLRKHAGKMPRTMLRYSIEKLTENERQYFLRMK